MCCYFAARLQDKATESVGDLVGVFKNPNAPTSPRKDTREARLKKKNNPYVENVKPAGPQGNELAIALMDSKRHEDGPQSAPKPNQAKDSQRRKSTGTTNVVTRTDSRLSNVGEVAADGQLVARTGHPHRRNRRSSGFLSLIGYAPKS